MLKNIKYIEVARKLNILKEFFYVKKYYIEVARKLNILRELFYNNYY